MKKAILIFISLLSIVSNAQQTYFNNRFDFNQSWWDYGLSIFSDSTATSVLLGSSNSSGTSGLLTPVFLQIDNNGNTINTKHYSFPFSNAYAGGPGSLYKLNNGFVFGGSKEDSIQVDALLIKLDSNGDTVWTKTFGDSTYQSSWMAKQTSDGGYLLCGETATTDTLANMLLIKTDSIGNLIWQKEYGYFGSEELALAFTHTADGGYAFAGRRLFPGPTTDIYILKVDSGGNFQWDTTYGSQWSDVAWSITSTLDGNFVIAGFYAYSFNDESRPYIAKFDLSGNMIWEKKYGDSFLVTGFYSIRELNDGSFIAVGEYNPVSPPVVVYGLIYKINSMGDSLWSNYYFNGMYSKNRLHDIYETVDGGFAACGYIVPYAPDTGHQDLWVLKVDSNGCEVSNCILNINKVLGDKEDIKVFPNPCNSELNIEMDNSSEKFDIYLFDILGKELMHYSILGNQIFSINTTNLSSGLFLIKLIGSNHCVISKIINHISN